MKLKPALRGVGWLGRSPFDRLTAPSKVEGLRRTSSTPHSALRVPPCPSTRLGVLSLSKDIWAFLSSLGEDAFFNIGLTAYLAKAEFSKEVFHQTPPRQGRLEEIGPDKRGEQEPVWAL